MRLCQLTDSTTNRALGILGSLLLESFIKRMETEMNDTPRWIETRGTVCRTCHMDTKEELSGGDCSLKLWPPHTMTDRQTIQEWLECEGYSRFRHSTGYMSCLAYSSEGNGNVEITHQLDRVDVVNCLQNDRSTCSSNWASLQILIKSIGKSRST